MIENHDSISVTVPKKAGLVFQLQNFPGTDFWSIAEKGELEQLLNEAKLWQQHWLGLLYYCDQCDYFNSNAEAVQEHNDREHNCRYVTYYTTDRFGAQVLRVRTVKCHRRPSRRWREV